MTVRIIQGDIREELPKLPADYFDCIVTSPPYYGLRDYGTATWEGGDPGCDHIKRTAEDISRSNGLGRIPGYRDNLPSDNSAFKGGKTQFRTECGKCGARRIDAQIGLESTLDAYLETMVAVCRELRRVLKPSGVMFLNLGDSYRDKQLQMMPARLGLALQADQWILRSHIIWAKSNPMPESVTDRPTSAHETIWMLTKSARYFWDGEAVAENAVTAGDTLRITGDQSIASGVKVHGNQLAENYNNKIRGNSRNIRNVWSVASHPFPGAHFATFPPALVERCIKAGSSERGCCPACGAPWERVVEGKTIEPSYRRGNKPIRHLAAAAAGIGQINLLTSNLGMVKENSTLYWRPSCDCRISGLIDCMPYTPIPSRILDPFAGAGTTGLVADRLGRDATLIDLNTSYIDMAVNRIRDDAPLFAKVAAE